MAHWLLAIDPMNPMSLHHPGDAVDWPAVRAALAGLDCDDSEPARERAAADYHWYSPVLAEANLAYRNLGDLKFEEVGSVGTVLRARAGAKTRAGASRPAG